MTATLNPRLQDIVDEFGAVPGQQKLQLLLEFSDELPPLPARYAEHRDRLEPVPECQSPLFLAVEVAGDGTAHLFFDAPREAPTTRGFAGILATGLDGLSAAGDPGHARRVHHPARLVRPGQPAAAARHGGDAGPDQGPDSAAAGRSQHLTRPGQHRSRAQPVPEQARPVPGPAQPVPEQAPGRYLAFVVASKLQ